MSGKLSRKERAQLQKAQQAEPVTAASQKAQPKRKTPPATARSPLIRNLNYILIALATVVYFNSLFNEYALDDYSLILENNQTKQGASAFFDIFRSTYREGYLAGDNSLYRPLSKAMFAIEYGWTQGPGISHFMNVVLFVLSVVLLFKMLRLYLRDQVLLPFIATVLFAVHPIHTEVVANIKGRDDILCFLLFVVTAIYAYRYSISRAQKHLMLTGAAFLLCLLSKESAVTFLAVIPLLFYFFTDAKTELVKPLALPLIGATTLFFIMRFFVLGGAGSNYVPVVDNYIIGIDGFITQRATAIAIAGVYLVKLFVPYELVSDASVPEFQVYTVTDWQFLMSFAVFAVAAVFAIMKFRSRHIVSFSILYFFITFSVVSNIPFILGTNYGERLLYTPSLGICLLVAYILVKFIQREETIAGSVRALFSQHTKALAITGVIAAVFTVQAVIRNAEWRNNETLWSTDLQKSPNSSKLHFFYGNHLTHTDTLALYKGEEKQWRIDTGTAHFRRSMELAPYYSAPVQKLAEMYLEKGQFDSSEYYYRKALELTPNSAMFRNNYGRMLFNAKRYYEAKVQFELAISFNVGYADAYNNLAGTYGTLASGYVMKAQQDPSRANEYTQKATELFTISLSHSLNAIKYNPNFVPAYRTTAMTYQNLGNQMKAQEYTNLANQLSQRR